MSFGFSAGDFLEVAQLAWRLYRDCYKVARGAPQEFQLLVAEMSTLSNSLTILQKEVKDPESTIVQAGEDRVRLVGGVVENISTTLGKLEKYAKKYEIMGSGSKARQKWTQIKWSFDWKSIEGLRSKLNQHNTMMSLVLTQVGNSSLQRIQSSTNALENDVQAIRGYIARHDKSDLLTPSLSVVEDEFYRSSMSATLLKHAEINQPWPTIGVSQWIETARWWLLQAQLEFYSIARQAQAVPVSVYANLVKASWILVDIIACHPQVSFLCSSSRAEVTSMSSDLKREFERIANSELSVPDLKEIKPVDLQIWEGNRTEILSFRPQNTPAHIDYALDDVWREEEGEKALLVKAATCELRAVAVPSKCIIYFLVQKDACKARLVAKNQNGSADMTISFLNAVELRIERRCIVIDGEKIILNNEADAKLLYCVLEAAEFYYHERSRRHYNLNALKAYIVLAAIKNQHQDLVAGLIANTSITTFPSDDLHVVHTIMAVANDFAQGKLHEGLFKWTRELHNPIMWAIQLGCAPLVELLISEGTAFGTLMHPAQNGMTALSMAAYCGHKHVARVLIASQKEDRDLLHARDENNNMALHYASARGHEKVVRLLLRSGANISAEGKLEQTALHFASEHDHPSIVQLLLRNGASHPLKANGLTPLLTAVQEKSESVLGVYLKEDIDFRKQDIRGMNVLHHALTSGLSKHMYDLLTQRYWKDSPMPQPKTRKVRSIVNLHIESNWAILFLDTRNAEIQYREPLPSHITDLHQKAIRLDRPASVHDKSFKYSFDFHVIHPPGPISFSHTAGASLIFTHPAYITITIHNGGWKRMMPSSLNGFWNHGSLDTDPNAEEVP